MPDRLSEPLRPGAARALIRAILASGTVGFSKHALREMEHDDLTTGDCVHALRGGVVEPGKLERGSYRYRVSTAAVCVVVAFRSDTQLVVVTAWRAGA